MVSPGPWRVRALSAVSAGCEGGHTPQRRQQPNNCEHHAAHLRGPGKILGVAPGCGRADQGCRVAHGHGATKSQHQPSQQFLAAQHPASVRAQVVPRPLPAGAASNAYSDSPPSLPSAKVT